MVTPLLPHQQGIHGGALVMYGQLAALIARHEVTLVTLAGPDPIEKEAIAHLRASGIDSHAVWRPAPTGLARWRRHWRLARGWLRGGRPLRPIDLFDPRIQQLLDQLLSTRSFDLIQVEDSAMGGYRYRAQVPAVLTEHEVGLIRANDARQRKASRIQRLLSEAEWRRWQQYEPAIWRRFDRIQVFTSRDAATMSAIAPVFAERVRINPFGIEIPPEINPEPEEAQMVVFVGWFGHPPNVDAALWLGNEIMPRLRARRPGVQLMIVGSQPPEAVRALACDDIVVTGPVPAVEPYLERASVVLAPLRTGGGMRLKVLQAMAHGKAVVTTPIGAEGLAVGDCQPPLIIAEDPEGIARATAELMDGDDARRTLGHRARAFVARHRSWLAYQQRLETIYRELVPGEPAPL